MKKIFLLFLLLITLGLLYLFFYPVSFEPVAYTPPPNPGFNGIFAKNNQLATLQPLLLDQGTGPEDITLGPDNFLYTGFEDGRIIRFSMDGKISSVFTKVDGRPLGMQFDTNGNLIICDAVNGLVAADSTGKISLLTNEVDGTKIYFADDLDIASDGVIWFTDASQRNHLQDIEREVWELQPTGRLLTYHPDTKKTNLVMDKMIFANGVALGPNEEYVLVNETVGTRIHKYWIKGSKKGQREIFINELPGFPDNISYNGNGTFWVAMPNQRIGQDFEQFYDKPFWRKVLKRLPTSITKAEAPAQMGIVLGFDLEGNVVANLQDSLGSFHEITSVNEYFGHLYLGSLKMPAVGKYKLNH